MKKILALILVLSVLLSSCTMLEKTKKAESVKESHTETTTEATLPTQMKMPAAEKDALLRRLEYALLCAAIDAEDREMTVKGWDVHNTQTYLGDYDGDGDEELICGIFTHTFDVAQRTNSYRFSQSGTSMYTDNEGTLYLQDSMGGGCDYEMDGMWVSEDGDSIWYSIWQDAEWVPVMSEDYGIIREIIMSENGQFVRFGKTISQSYSAEIGDRVVTQSEYDRYCEELGLKRISATAASFTCNRVDGSYADDLLAEAERYLNEIYGCLAMDADIDGDGEAERLLFLTGDLVQVWMNCISYNDQVELKENAQFYLEGLINPRTPRTCLLVADREEDQLILQAVCVQAQLSVREGMELRYADGFFWLDGYPAYMPGTYDSLTPSALNSYIAAFGYDQCILRSVDVCDMPGAEYMCLYQRDGEWYLLIFVYVNGDLRPIYCCDLNGSALYLVENEGKQCLLAYSQYISGDYTGYSYTLLHFDEGGATQMLENEYIGYFGTDADATAVGQFFDKLNVHLVKIIVIRDPYRLTGRMWMKQEEIDYGTVPAEDQPATEDAQEPVMGFVQINDPSSWLNLRQGPGTNYPRVLVDESNPNSFIKQALGAPVTVLEIVETGDAVNPVWVKVRISYGNREYVGYSSKTYIRIPGEE